MTAFCRDALRLSPVTLTGQADRLEADTRRGRRHRLRSQILSRKCDALPIIPLKKCTQDCRTRSPTVYRLRVVSTNSRRAWGCGGATRAKLGQCRKHAEKPPAHDDWHAETKSSHEDFRQKELLRSSISPVGGCAHKSGRASLASIRTFCRAHQSLGRILSSARNRHGTLRNWCRVRRHAVPRASVHS